MTYRYSKSGTHEAEVDPDRCAASVSSHGGWRSVQCSRKRKVGDWCKQHSPEAEKAREKASIANSQAQADARNYPYKRIKELDAEIARLRELVRDALGLVDVALEGESQQDQIDFCEHEADLIDAQINPQENN